MSVISTVLIYGLGLLTLLTFLSIVVLSMIYLERRILGRLQRRVGPTRTGPFGLLQPVADAIKLVVKEDVVPNEADRVLFWVAPLAVFVPGFMVWVTIPFAPEVVLRNLGDMGLFYVIAFSTLGIVGLVMAGWSSANKYAVLGGLRSAAQLISYEIPLIMAALAIVMLSGTMNLADIVDAQVLAPLGNAGAQLGLPYVVVQPLGLLIFLIAGLAEVGRTPFDIYFAESEIVGGPFVEYSGAHWAVFFLAEYIATFAIAALITLLYLGGWHGPTFGGIPAILWHLLWFFFKAYAVVLLIFWIRGTFPRLRIDQLMAFGWKVLIPLSFANILLTGLHLFFGWPWWILTLLSIGAGGVGFYEVYRRLRAPLKNLPRPVYRRVGGS